MAIAPDRRKMLVEYVFYSFAFFVLLLFHWSRKILTGHMYSLGPFISFISTYKFFSLAFGFTSW